MPAQSQSLLPYQSGKVCGHFQNRESTLDLKAPICARTIMKRGLTSCAIAAILFLLALSLSASPAAHAQAPSITLNAYSCHIYPLAGYPSCTVSPNSVNPTEPAWACISWSYPSSFSVGLTRIPGPGSISENTCSSTDIGFSFTVTWTPSSCTAGQYTITFAGYNGDGTNYANFTAIVICTLSPGHKGRDIPGVAKS